MSQNQISPIYIVSKNRADTRLTSKTLEEMGLYYQIIVEESQYEMYASVIDKDKVVVLPEKYLNEYNTCDDLGRTKSTGPGAARNFAWDLGIKTGAKWHWVMDDNIYDFGIYNNNFKIKVNSPKIFSLMEEFVNRYQNIAISGPNYYMFIPRKTKVPPFVLNTRIYSCLLIRNSLPYRWRGRYNEDTDLSLRALKDGWCTLQFNYFYQHKAPTQTVKGGNDSDFYHKEGTLPKSQMLVQLHPDVTKLVWRFSRPHHLVDYKVFKKNKLIKKKDLIIPKHQDKFQLITLN